jgi:hypothetical protein
MIGTGRDRTIARKKEMNGIDADLMKDAAQMTVDLKDLMTVAEDKLQMIGTVVMITKVQGEKTHLNELRKPFLRETIPQEK